ncbi:MAG: type II toxin-antitoxin system RelB/DinJ family antitoxin [Spirochaetaceae bacterium]|nr:type II toxin-antitoxin system RelB/DinJ family antitoxin [Spirochaetaceae bacterium]
MAQTTINFRIDENLKKEVEQICKEMGMSLTTAFTIFATKVKQDRRIPFEVTAEEDPFYSEENMARLREIMGDIDAGREILTPHELIEVE